MKKTQHVKSSNILTTILIIVCLLAVSMYMYRSIIDKIEYNREATIEAFEEERFNVIWTSLEALQLEAENNVTEISHNIEKDILSLSSDDLKQLQNDMNNDIENNSLHEILERNTKGKTLNGINNHMNGIVVMTIDGYIEDYNYYRAVDDSSSNIRVWEVTINNSYNKELEKDAIDKLLNRHSGIIALESYNLTKNDNHIMINELTYNSLLNVFLEEGLNGLRNYQIFVPYYITDFGDIFGNPDIVHGVKVDSNKLIIVQEFNLYDQIVNNHSDVFNGSEINNVIDRYDNLLRLMYIFGIMLVCFVTLLVGYLSNTYNKLVCFEEDEEEALEDEEEKIE